MTLLLLAKIREHKEAHLEALKNKVLFHADITLIRDDLNQIKGQIFTLELIEDLEMFLEEEETINEEIQTDGDVRNS